MSREKQKYIMPDSLMISTIALNNIKTPFEHLEMSCLNRTSFSTQREVKPTIFKIKRYFSNYEVQQTTKSLLTTLTNIFDQKNKKICTTVERQIMQQYLRRFSFLYQSFVLKTYPNDLSKINYYKMNMLAIKNLYILNNL
jgi:hypothetical protein